MISRPSGFKFIERNHDSTILLIPGWATDYRIFGSLDLPFNYLMPDRFSPFDFGKMFSTALDEQKLNGVSILGWSMGSFIAAEVASKYPQNFKDIILVSVKKRYDKEMIENIKAYINKNKIGYLCKFYNDFFSDREKEASDWFRRNLLKKYIKEMSPDLLLEGLDYLSGAELRTEDLKGLSIKFIHGEDDRIAPVDEAARIAKALPRAVFVSIEAAGHAPFLRTEFKEAFSGGRG